MTMTHQLAPGAGVVHRQFQGQANLPIMLDIQQTLMPEGKLTLVSKEVIDRWPRPELRLWLHLRAIYCLPTIELIDWLRVYVSGRPAIEIGAGYGLIGESIGIPCTDSRLQEVPAVRAHYHAQGQPTIPYPAQVQRLEALAAVKKHRPRVVIAAWVTHLSREGDLHGSSFGVDEVKLLDRVQEYIFIGHEQIHNDRPLLKVPHETYHLDFIRSRASDLPGDVIYVWKNPRWRG